MHEAAHGREPPRVGRYAAETEREGDVLVSAASARDNGVMRGVCAWFAVAVVLSVGGAASADSTRREAVGAQTIVFLRDQWRDSRAAMLVESDGSRLRRAPFPRYPIYSPDRRHALWTKVLNTRQRIWGQLVVANSNGSGRHVVTTQRGTCIDAAWSPNGETIAYTAVCDLDFTSIWIVDRDGTNRKRLTGTWNWRPVWSPDGRTILYTGLLRTKGGQGTYRLFLMDADGRHKRVIRGRYPNDAYPAVVWSRDGRRIFVAEGGKLIVMNRDGSGLRDLTPPDLYVAGFALSPDQRWIAVHGTTTPNPPKSGRDIFVIPTRGGPAKRLTKAPGPDRFPAWSPDGKKIAFESNRDGNSEIYLMNADGSAQTNLTNNPADDSWPVAWPAARTAFADSGPGS